MQSCTKALRAEPTLVIIVIATILLTFKRRPLNGMYTWTWRTSCFSLKTFLLCCFLLFLFVILDIHFLKCFYIEDD